MASGKIKSASKQYKSGATGGSIKKASPAKAAKAGQTKMTNKKPSGRGC
jgi:hypothetical protein